jgi:tellurite resistance protein
LVLGATVDVSRNRISENVGSVVLSMITNADIMNITSFNQTTHVNAAFVMTSALRAFSDPATDTEEERKVSKFLRNENNQVMFVKHWMDGATQLPNTLTDTSPGPPSAFLLRIRRTLRRNFLRVLQNQNR